MSVRKQTAFVTGGSRGIGLAVTEHLLSKNYQVFIADRDITGAKALADRFNSNPANGSDFSTHKVYFAECDVSSWPSQLSAFRSAIATFGRIDFVAAIAGIGERKWIPGVKEIQEMKEGEFKEPDLSVVDVDLKGVMFTVGLAVQQFRRQEKDANGFRGKIGCVASVCGFYAIPTLPIYTAAKHGVVGLVRTYGKFLPEEGITFNAVCPNIVRTGISTSTFYDKVEKEGLLVPMKGLLDAFQDFLLGHGSGEVYEVGPKGGWVIREGAWYLDEKCGRSCELLVERGRVLHD